MKVLLIVKKLDFGGAENHVIDLANTLSDLGHQVWVVAGKGRGTQDLRKKVRNIPLRFNDLYLVSQVFFIARLVRQEGIQVIHAHQRLPILISCLVGMLTRVPVVATLHGQLKYDIRYKFEYLLLSRLIVVCPFWQDIVNQKSSILKSKTVVIPNGVKLISNNDKQRTPFKLLYASRIDKSHQAVIAMLIEQVLPKLAEEFPNISLDVAGDGTKLNSLKNLAERTYKEKCNEIVKFLGYQRGLNEIITEACLVLGTGRVALETLAQGVPFLPVRHDRLGSAVTTQNFDYLAYNNFVPRDSPAPNAEGFINAIRTVINDYSFYQNETEKISLTVKKSYNLNHITERILNLYEEAAHFKDVRES